MAKDKDKQTKLDDSSPSSKKEHSTKTEKDVEKSTQSKKEKKTKQKTSKKEKETEPKSSEETTENVETVEEESQNDETNNIAIEVNKENLLKTASVLGAIMLVLLIGTALMNQDQTQPTEETSPNTVLTTVNGEPITQADLSQQQTLLTNLGSQQLPEEDLLELLIDETVIYLEAQQRNVTVSTQEAENQLREDLNVTGTTIEEYKSQVEQRGISYDELLAYLEKQLSISNVLDQEVQNITVTDQEIQELYNETQDSFIQPRQATVRQILLAADGENETVRNEAEQIQSVLEEDLSQFCDYVENRTVDEASIPNCGEYNVTREDPFVQEFKDAALNMSVGELRIIQSDFGYHILVKDDEREEQLQSLEDVREQIETQIRIEQEQQIVSNVSEQLRQQYNVTKPSDVQELDEDTSEEQGSVNTTEQETEETQETEPGTEGQDEQSEEPVEEQPVEETTQEPQQEPDRERADLGQCLEDADATLYVVDWSPESQEQLVILGSLEDSTTVIDCDEQTQQCERQAVNAYPTWELNGEETLGLKTRTSLRNTLSCYE